VIVGNLALVKESMYRVTSSDKSVRNRQSQLDQRGEGCKPEEGSSPGEVKGKL